MSKTLFEYDMSATDAQVATLLNMGSSAGQVAIQALINMTESILGGNTDASVTFRLGMDSAQIVGTFTGNPSNGETFTIGGQTITAVTAGATANQFNIGVGATANAAAAVAAINASSTLGTWVTASNVAGAMTIVANLPGKMGNAITLADAMSNFAWAGAATRLALGDQNSIVTYTCGYSAETT